MTLANSGGCVTIPDETIVNEYKLTELSDTFITLNNNPGELLTTLHQRAHDLLAQGRVEEAWKTLLSYNAR
jgi:hypothetical protein